MTAHKFLITVTDNNKAGSYNGKLQDDILIQITIKGVNLPPRFDSDPASIELEVFETYSILLSVSDPDISDTLTITGKVDEADFPSFIAL